MGATPTRFAGLTASLFALAVPMVAPEPFTPSVMEALHAAIRSVFSENALITPDRVRGGRAALEEAAPSWRCRLSPAMLGPKALPSADSDALA